MRACIQALSSIFRTNQEYIEEKYGETRMSPFLQRVIANLFGSYELAPGICNAATKNDFAELKPLLEQLIEPENSVFVESSQYMPMDSESKPTSGFKPDYPMLNYQKLSNEQVTFLVMSQDLSFGSYNEDLFVR